MIRVVLLREVTRSHWYKWAEEITKWLVLLKQSLLHGFVEVVNPSVIILDSGQTKTKLTKKKRNPKKEILRSVHGFRAATVLFGNLVSYIKWQNIREESWSGWSVGSPGSTKNKLLFTVLVTGLVMVFGYHSCLGRFSFIFTNSAVISGPTSPTWYVLCFDCLLHPTPASHSLINSCYLFWSSAFAPCQIVGQTDPSSIFCVACYFPQPCSHLDYWDFSACLNSREFSGHTSACLLFFMWHFWVDILQLKSLTLLNSNQTTWENIFIWLMFGSDINLRNASENGDFFILFFWHKLLNLNWGRAFDG